MATGFGFGAKTTAAPAFGSGNLTFGTAAGQPQPGNFSFGTGAAPVAAAPNLFGTPAVATAPATTSSLFGTPAQTTGLFGAVAPSTSAPSLSFGTPAATGTFGTPAATGTFGSAATSAPTGLAFGAPIASAAPTFGLGSQTAAVAPTVTSSASLPSFGFGSASTAIANAPTLAANLLGTPATTASATGINFGFGGGMSATTTASIVPTTTAAATPFVGLGGINTSNQSKTTTVTAQKEVPPKEQTLPNEILQTVDSFKQMVKQQKIYSSEIARCSIRDIRLVEQEISELNHRLNALENQVRRNRLIAEHLKYDTANEVKNVEMAQRTQAIPPGLQHENTDPMKFFFDLTDHFENKMQMLKTQTETIAKYIKEKENSNPISNQELTAGMKHLHETFVALAGRLQSIHNQVEAQKEAYLNARKRLLNDANNPFEKLEKTPVFHESPISKFKNLSPKVVTGPTPFNNLSLRNGSVVTPQQPSMQPPFYPSINMGTATTGLGFGINAFGGSAAATQPSNTSLFNTPGFGQNTFGNTSFQLQQPPTGNKRGKM